MHAIFEENAHFLSAIFYYVFLFVFTEIGQFRAVQILHYSTVHIIGDSVSRRQI